MGSKDDVSEGELVYGGFLGHREIHAAAAALVGWVRAKFDGKDGLPDRNHTISLELAASGERIDIRLLARSDVI